MWVGGDRAETIEKKNCLRYAEGSKKKKDNSKVMVPVGRQDSEVVNGDRREARERD